MQKYIGILREDSLAKAITKYRRKLVNEINTYFNENAVGVADSIMCFLVPYSVLNYKERKSKYINCFYPVLNDLDLRNVYSMISTNLVKDLPNNIEDCLGTEEFKWNIKTENDKFQNIFCYMDDYASCLIEARIINNSIGEISKMNDSDIYFICKMCFGEFLTQLDLLDKGKSNIYIGARKRIDEVLDDNTMLENELSKLKKEKAVISNELSKYKNKKEKIIYLRDDSTIAKLNKEIREKNNEIDILLKNKKELESIISATSVRCDNEKEKTFDVDFELKYVFVGGNINVINRLKIIFPNSIFCDNERIIDKRCLDDAFMIIYFTNNISHSLYYKIKGLCANNKQVHCSNDNVVKIIDIIAESQ